jgi:DNA repair protein SbcD/Mre11
MRKFLFVVDPHIRGTNPVHRKGDLREDIKAKFAEVYSIAAENKVDAIIYPGDILDSPEVALGVAFDFAEVLSMSPVPQYTTIGNHDVYGYNLDTYYRTSLRLLQMVVPNLSVFYRPGDNVMYDDVLITFEPYSSQIDVNGYGYCPPEYTDDFEGVRIHVAHGMLLDHDPPFDRYTKVQDVHTTADILLTGHDHTGYGIYKRPDGKIICNPGSLTRLAASQSEINRQIQVALITVHKHKEFEVELIPLKCAKPGEDVLDRSGIEAENKRQYAMEQFAALIKTQTGEAVILNVPQIVETIAAQEKYDPAVVKMALELIEAEREKMGVV